jgi:hypothetical protein
MQLDQRYIIIMMRSVASSSWVASRSAGWRRETAKDAPPDVGLGSTLFSEATDPPDPPVTGGSVASENAGLDDGDMGSG